MTKSGRQHITKQSPLFGPILLRKKGHLIVYKLVSKSFVNLASFSLILHNFGRDQIELKTVIHYEKITPI